MAFDNNISVVGNLTRPPELRFTPTGAATATFGIAVNRSWTDRQSQEKKEEVSFFDVVVWGSLAENAATSLDKGSRVVVTGRLQQRSWDGDDGVKHYKVEIVGDEIAPSLRWATVNIVRNERRDGSPVQEPPAGYNTGTKQAPVAAPAAVTSGGNLTFPDEEPFVRLEICPRTPAAEI